MRSLASDLTLKASVAFHLEFECETSSMQIYRLVPTFIGDIKWSPSAVCDMRPLKLTYGTLVLRDISNKFNYSPHSVFV